MRGGDLASVYEHMNMTKILRYQIWFMDKVVDGTGIIEKVDIRSPYS